MDTPIFEKPVDISRQIQALETEVKSLEDSIQNKGDNLTSEQSVVRDIIIKEKRELMESRKADWEHLTKSKWSSIPF